MIDLKKSFENKMSYPEDFAKKCIEIYPDNEEIKELLRTQSFLLGSVLKKLISKDETDQEKIDLYETFEALYKEQYTSKGKIITAYGLIASSKSSLKQEIKKGKLIPVEKMTYAQVVSIQNNIESRINQNEERRLFGEIEAGKQYTR